MIVLNSRRDDFVKSANFLLVEDLNIYGLI